MANEFVTAGVNLQFNYAAGEAASRFLIALRDEKKIYGTRCPACRRVLAPARSFCPRCFVETREWVEVGPTGAVIALAPTRDLALALIRLDGADTAFAHRINAANADTLRIGLRVVPVFAETRTGNILDIVYFVSVQVSLRGAANCMCLARKIEKATKQSPIRDKGIASSPRSTPLRSAHDAPRNDRG